jgi:hypothetical protein
MVVGCVTVKKDGKVQNAIFHLMNVKFLHVIIMAVALMVIVIVNVDGKDHFVTNPIA